MKHRATTAFMLAMMEAVSQLIADGDLDMNVHAKLFDTTQDNFEALLRGEVVDNGTFCAIELSGNNPVFLEANDYILDAIDRNTPKDPNNEPEGYKE